MHELFVPFLWDLMSMLYGFISRSQIHLNQSSGHYQMHCLQYAIYALLIIFRHCSILLVCMIIKNGARTIVWYRLMYRYKARTHTPNYSQSKHISLNFDTTSYEKSSGSSQQCFDGTTNCWSSHLTGVSEMLCRDWCANCDKY